MFETAHMAVIRSAASLCLGLTCLVSSTLSSASDPYPDKPVTLLVAWAAGGSTDIVARSIQPVLARQLGTDVVIKNVNGAGGTIGTAEAARASADGYTLLVTPAGPMTTQPNMRKLPYDLESFEPIGRITVSHMAMMVTKDSPYHTLDDVISAARQNSGQVKFASSGIGTLPHIAILALNEAANIETKHVPFKGSAEALKGLLGGVVEIFSDQSQAIAQYELRPIAAWGDNRLSDYPDVPTMQEQGYDFNLSNWIGMFTPAGTPAEIKDRLNSALKATLDDPAVVSSFKNLKLEASGISNKDFTDLLHAEYSQNNKYLASAGLVKD